MTRKRIGEAKGASDAAGKLKAMMYGTDRGAQLAWNVTKEVLAYSANRVGEIADDVEGVAAVHLAASGEERG